MKYFPVYNLGGKNYTFGTYTAVLSIASGKAPSSIETLLSKYGAKIIDTIKRKQDTLLLVELGGDYPDLFEFSRTAFLGDRVNFAQPNLARRVIKRHSPNDLYYRNQWFLNNTGQGGAKAGHDISAEAAWDIEKGKSSVYIGVIDDGVDWDHEDLNGKVKYKYDYIDSDSDPTPVAGTSPIPGEAVGHGTGVSGIIAAQGNNSAGVSGVCPDCSLIGVRMIGTSGGSGYMTDWRFAQSFDFCVNKGAAAINNSWGSDLGDPFKSGDEPKYPIEPTPNMRSAIRDAVNNGRGGLGTVVIFAAGNSNCDVRLDGTTAMAEVVAVGASTDHGDRAYYSNFGEELDVNAPSSGIGQGYDDAGTSGQWTTDDMGSAGYNTGRSWMGDSDGHYFNQFGGTSGAAPIVAGIVGLIVSAKSSLTEDAIREMLEDTADKNDFAGGTYNAAGHSNYYGYGRVNAEKALMAAIGSTCYPREEICDKRDNDCDDQIDEDNVCIGYARFCEACEKDENCAAHGAVCNEGDEPLHYCTLPCNPEYGNCPPGSSCKELNGDYHCVPNYDHCGSLLSGADLVCYECTGYSPNECGDGGACLVDANGRPSCAIPCDKDNICPATDLTCFTVEDIEGVSYGNYCFPASQRCEGDAPKGGKELCERCISPVECGGNNDQCINYGSPIAPDAFCARDCSNEDCPMSYTCQMIPNKAGAFAMQCVPASGDCQEKGGAEWGCGSEAVCEFIDEGAGWACLPKVFENKPSGEMGKLFGECKSDLTCDDGVCVTSPNIGLKPLCLMTNCAPDVIQEDDKRQFDVPVAACGTDEECVPITFGTTSTWVCVPKDPKAFTGPWGETGESGGECASDDTCEGAFCLKIFSDPPYLACFNRCEPDGNIPDEIGDRCKNECEDDLVCAPTEPYSTCAAKCDPSNPFCSDGSFCNDMGGGIGFCSLDKYEPPDDDDDVTDDDDDDDNNDDEDTGVADTGGGNDPFDFGTTTDDDDNNNDDDDNDDDFKPAESSCSCRVNRVR